MKPIILVENLGKQYRIGAPQARYGSLRESLVGAVRAPLDRLRRNGRSGNDSIWALKHVSFEVHPGEVVGIIGRNGAGKSTLLKVLSRITEPTTGGVDLYGQVGSLLEVGTGFHPELTGRENIYLNGAILGMRRVDIEKSFDDIVDFAEIEKFLDTPVKRYSSGMYIRLAFAVAAHLNPEILIIDEVLAVGDSAFQKKCLGKMNDVAKEGRTVLFVSHNMSAIADLCTQALLLDEGRIIKRGELLEVVSTYLNQGPSNKITFSNRVLTKASINQVGDSIVIEAEYKTDHDIRLPSLGFVISDTLGNPICGSNPVLEKIIPSGVPNKTGRVKVILSYPQLLDGTYTLSLWFGDGKEDFFAAKDCLTFEVVNMSPVKQLPISTVGPVFPKCNWYFEGL